MANIFRPCLSRGRYRVCMEFDPASMRIADRYKLMVGAIVPRPIAFVSTVSPDGRANLAPYSFFNGIGSDPMTLLFCPANKPDGTEKDSLINSSAPPVGTGEFVVNVVSEAYADRMALTSAELPYGESEFDHAGFAAAPCAKVRAPRVVESPIAFECRTIEVVRLGVGRPAGGNVVIGEVVWIHAADGVVDERLHVNPDVLDAVGRMGGRMYSRTRDRFEIAPSHASKGGGG